MKVEELKEGKVYQCVLSNSKMLVVKTERPEQAVQGEKGEKVVIEDAKTVMAGKYCIFHENGAKQFQLDELVDGQLKELKD